MYIKIRPCNFNVLNFEKKKIEVAGVRNKRRPQPTCAWPPFPGRLAAAPVGGSVSLPLLPPPLTFRAWAAHVDDAGPAMLSEAVAATLWRSFVPARCAPALAAAGQPAWRCLLADAAVSHVRRPLLVRENMFTTAQLYGAFGAPPAERSMRVLGDWFFDHGLLP